MTDDPRDIREGDLSAIESAVERAGQGRHRGGSHAAPRAAATGAVGDPDASTDDPENAPGDASEFSGVASGVRWSAISAMVLRLAQFMLGIVAARLLPPEEQGPFVVALTVYSIVLTLSDLGVINAILRYVHRTREIAPTVNTLNMSATVLVAGSVAVLAHPLASLMHSPAATPAIRVLALTMVAGGLGSIPAMILSRDYKQRERFLSDGANFVVSSALMLVLALNGVGFMSLAWSRLAGQVVSAIVLNLVCKERYGYGWDPQVAREMLRFSLPLAGAAALTVAIWDIDNIAIARLYNSHNTTMLPSYQYAFNVAQWPIGVFSQILLNITMTTFARSQHDTPMLRTHLKSFMLSLAAATLPVSALLMALARPLVLDLYGAKWQGAVAPLVVLGLFSTVRLVQVMFTDLLTALGKTAVLFRLQVLWLAVLAPVMFLFVHLWGAVGAAWAHVTIGLGLVVPAYIIVMLRTTDIGWSWLSLDMLRPLVGAVAAGLAALVIDRTVHQPFVSLILGGIVGLAVYAAVTGTWLVRHFKEVRGIYSRSGDAGSGAGDDALPTAGGAA